MPRPEDNIRTGSEDQEVSQPLPLPKTVWTTFLEKMAIAARLFGKEVYRKKLQWFDLKRADYRLGKKAYSLGQLEGQTQLGSRLDILSERLAHLRQSGGKPTSTFGRKAKAIFWTFTKAVRICWLKLGRRRTLKQLGAKLREAVPNESLEKEKNIACALVNRISSLSSDIGELTLQTYPWTRRPLLLAFLLLVGALIGFGSIEARRHQLSLTNRNQDTPALLSQSDLQRMLAQSQKFSEESERRQEESSRQEAERMQQQITDAQRAYKEQRDREDAEQDRVTAQRAKDDRVREEQEAKLRQASEQEQAEQDRIAAEKQQREKIESEKEERSRAEREQAERNRIAGEKKKQEEERVRIAREQSAREEQARQQAAEEKKKEAERIAAEAERKKQAEQEQQAEALKTFRQQIAQETLSNARLNVVYSFPRDMGTIGNLYADKAGDLYGFASGAVFSRTAFKITPKGEFTTILAWKEGDLVGRYDPDFKTGAVQGNDGNFYGTTPVSVYRMTPAGQFSVIHKFSSGEGAADGGLTRGKDGNFYGVTRMGGTTEGGTIFKVTSSGTLTTLHNFLKYGDDGYVPEGGLVQASDGKFYGTTSTGGTHGGDIEMTPKGLRHKSTEQFGTVNGGTIFSMSTDGRVTTLYRLDQRPWRSSWTNADEPEGRHPTNRLSEGSDGNFYGTTSGGGKHGHGTIFRITPHSELTVLYEFDDEGPAIGGLAKAVDGNLYGITTGIYRSSNRGTIFRVAPNGQVTIVYVFRDRSGGLGHSGWFPFDDPAMPVSVLHVGSDGKLYSLTQRGGANGGGTFFGFDPSDSFVPSEQDKLKAERIASTASPPGRRRSGAEIVAEIAGGILERAAEADAAHLNHSKSVVAASGGAKMLCPKCGGSKKMVQHDYNSSYNPHRAGTLPGALFENGRNSTSVVNCDRCGGTGVVDAR
jgi:uncharacterized repeat protein (TIGR03803 family)